MLNGDFREARSDTVPIADVSASDFRDFLAWLYGNPSIVNGQLNFYHAGAYVLAEISPFALQMTTSWAFCASATSI